MPPTSQPHRKREVKRTNYVGIDVGKNRCAVCVADEKGEILRELTYMNTRGGIEELAERQIVTKTGIDRSNLVLDTRL